MGWNREGPRGPRPPAPPPPPWGRRVRGWEPVPSGIADPVVPSSPSGAVPYRPPTGAPGAFPPDACDYCDQDVRAPSGRTCANCGAPRPARQGSPVRALRVATLDGEVLVPYRGGMRFADPSSRRVYGPGRPGTGMRYTNSSGPR